MDRLHGVSSPIGLGSAAKAWNLAESLRHTTITAVERHIFASPELLCTPGPRCLHHCIESCSPKLGVGTHRPAHLTQPGHPRQASWGERCPEAKMQNH